MISHPRETLFVHIPKTAGQSVEMVFLEDQGFGWQDRAWLLLRHNRDRKAGPEKLAHLYADEYVACRHITPERFARYRKFAIVRHPYDRALSEYRYRLAVQKRRSRGDDVLGFDEFLAMDFSDDHLDLSRHLVPQVRYVTDRQGALLVDDILRFETLASDIKPLFQAMFGEMRHLPHRNRSGYPASLTAEMLTSGQRKLLQERYREDFEMFGYDG